MTTMDVKHCCGLAWGTILGFVFYFALTQIGGDADDHSTKGQGVYICSWIVSCLLGTLVLFIMYMAAKKNVFKDIIDMSKTQIATKHHILRFGATMTVLLLLVLYLSFTAHSAGKIAKRTTESSFNYAMGIILAVICSLLFIALLVVQLMPYLKKVKPGMLTGL